MKVAYGKLISFQSKIDNKMEEIGYRLKVLKEEILIKTLGF